MIISINKKSIRVEVNASTLIVYEDRFKGRRLLQDIFELSAIKDLDKVPFALVSKLIWAAAKTADNTTPDLYEWIAQMNIAEVIGIAPQILAMYYSNIETVKKPTAAARIKQLFRRFKFWHTQHGAD